jgi:hypothetical protein
MKKIFLSIIGLSIVFPFMSWGEDTSGDNSKYIPRTVETGNASASKDDYGDIKRYRYNPIQDQWEWRANKAAINYNPMENQWTYVYPGEVLRFNPAENKWDYQFIEKQLRYDIFDEQWFYHYTPPKQGQELKTKIPSSNINP